MRTKHTWQINTLGRDVIPIMNNIANLPGGHKPLNLRIFWLTARYVMSKLMPGRWCCIIFD
ncbi:diguanylate cyclase [Klebsiella pneumoniae]|uniref:Diguanylate cyclase n=1 Tax=Klebsiella pneumoniae TaxID=573 RepID=A0A377TT00_KLEPN|nr:diguanylate cyclase [Klebsiella pneumoniae]